MNVKYVKINEGGKITMKDETEGSMYTEEESKLGDELCEMIDADQELKSFYRNRMTSVLKEFAKTMILAYEEKDTPLGLKALNSVSNMMKALTMHIYIKVTMKKKKVK